MVKEDCTVTMILLLFQNMQYNIIKDLFLLVESLHLSNTGLISVRSNILKLKEFRERTNEEVLARARADLGDSGGKFSDLCTKDALTVAFHVYR